MFGNLGDIAGLLKKARQMQENIKTLKEEMARKEFTGVSTGGQVEVLIRGDFTVQRIVINPEGVDRNEVAKLEQLLMEAVNKALDEVKASAREKLAGLTGGLNIPGIF